VKIKYIFNPLSGKFDAITPSDNVIKQTEIDFGSMPTTDVIFTIMDSTVKPTSHIIARMAYEVPTGKELDETEMDDLNIICKAGSGQFDMFIRSIDNSYLADKFKVNYIVG
jgi:hypothetical protein